MEQVNGSASEAGETNKRMGYQNLDISILLQDEEELPSTVQELKEVAGVIGREIREKEEAIKTLTRRVGQLKAGGTTTSTRSLPKQDGVLQGWGAVSVPPEKMWESELLNENGSPKPKPEGKDDDDDTTAEIEAVLLFPEEVWKAIFDKLSDDPHDLWNCANACGLFEEILHPWKTGWMLGKALPYMYRHLPRNKLLECRTISKSWNRAVDSFLEDHPSLRPHDPVKVDPRRMDIVMPTREKLIAGREGYYKFTFDRNLGNPSALFSIDGDGKFRRTSGRKPFLIREVKLDHLFEIDGPEEDTEAIQRWWGRLFNFLEVYGKDIWYLRLTCPYYEDDGSKQKFLELFNFKLFQRLPNLRSLIMLNMGSLFGCEFPYLPADQLVLPPAPNLETLSFYEEYPAVYNSPFKPLLVRYHIQLRKLELPVRTWRVVSHLDWPNLTDLLLLDVKRSQDLRVAGIPCSLTKMALCLEGQVSFQGLIDYVNKLSAATQLRTLRLQGTFKFEGPLLMLHTSGSVKTLELIRNTYDSKSVPGSYGKVIAAFPLIENVHICYSQGFDFDSEIALTPEDHFEKYKDFRTDRTIQIAAAAKNIPIEIIDVEKVIYSGRSPLASPPPGAIFNSNMWDMLPHLRVFTFQWNVYTREECDAYKYSKRVPQL